MKGSHILRDILNTPNTLASRNSKAKQIPTKHDKFPCLQRRLLARFKDKTPTPLTNLDTLMEGTYRHVLEATDEVEVASAAVASSGNGLACITSILVFLLNLTATASLAGKISVVVEK